MTDRSTAQAGAPDQGGGLAEELAYRLRQQQLTAEYGRFARRTHDAAIWTVGRGGDILERMAETSRLAPVAEDCSRPIAGSAEASFEAIYEADAYDRLVYEQRLITQGKCLRYIRGPMLGACG